MSKVQQHIESSVATKNRCSSLLHLSNAYVGYACLRGTCCQSDDLTDKRWLETRKLEKQKHLLSGILSGIRIRIQKTKNFAKRLNVKHWTCLDVTGNAKAGGKRLVRLMFNSWPPPLSGCRDMSEPCLKFSNLIRNCWVVGNQSLSCVRPQDTKAARLDVALMFVSRDFSFLGSGMVYCGCEYISFKVILRMWNSMQSSFH